MRHILHTPLPTTQNNARISNTKTHLRNLDDQLSRAILVRRLTSDVHIVRKASNAKRIVDVRKAQALNHFVVCAGQARNEHHVGGGEAYKHTAKEYNTRIYVATQSSR